MLLDFEKDFVTIGVFDLDVELLRLLLWHLLFVVGHGYLLEESLRECDVNEIDVLVMCCCIEGYAERVREVEQMSRDETAADVWW